MKVLQSIESNFPNTYAAGSAINKTQEAIGDAKRSVFETQGFYDTDEEFLDYCRDLAKNVAATFEKEIRDNADDSVVNRLLKYVSHVEEEAREILFAETGLE